MNEPWTSKDVWNLLDEGGGQMVADAHNAALEQLLWAQAAMKLHNDINGDVCHIEANLDALNEHDAEVRKPLVDALEWIVENGEEGTSILTKARDALAKVKQ